MEKTRKKTDLRVVIIRIATVLAAAGTFAMYFVRHRSDWPLYDFICPFFALFLFAFVLFIAAPRIAALFSGEDEFPVLKGKKVWRKLLLVMLAAFAFHIAAVAVGMSLYSIKFGTNGFKYVAHNAWMKSNTDAGHYLTIAKDWYVKDGDDKLLIVFFPMLPVLIRGLNHLTHNGLISAQLINTAATVLLAGTAYLTFRSPLGEKRAVAGAFITLLMPGSIFFNSPMTEPLFLLFTFAAFYFMQKKKFLLAGVFVALSGFTRSLGVLAAIPLAITGVGHIVSLAKRKKNCFPTVMLLLLGCIISTFGTLGYLYINWSVHGDPLKFLEYQASNWSQKSCPFFDTTRYIIHPYFTGAIQKHNWDNVIALWAPQLVMIFGSLAVMLFAARKLPAAYTVYFLGYFAVAVGCTWLLSSVRYLSAAVPLIAALALFCDKKWKTAALFPVLGAAYFGYMYMYMARMQIY